MSQSYRQRQCVAMHVSEGCAAPLLNGMACCRALPSLSTDWLDAILRSIHPGPARLSARAPPLRGCACTQLRCVQSCPCYRRETHDDKQPKLRLAACLFVPRRGGARAEIVACRAGLCPPLRNRALGRPISPWGDISLRLPQSSLSPARAVGKLGSCGKTRHAFACCCLAPRAGRAR